MGKKRTLKTCKKKINRRKNTLKVKKGGVREKTLKLKRGVLTHRKPFKKKSITKDSEIRKLLNKQPLDVNDINKINGHIKSFGYFIIIKTHYNILNENIDTLYDTVNKKAKEVNSDIKPDDNVKEVIFYKTEHDKGNYNHYAFISNSLTASQHNLIIKLLKSSGYNDIFIMTNNTLRKYNPPGNTDSSEPSNGPNSEPEPSGTEHSGPEPSEPEPSDPSSVSSNG